MDFVHRKYKQTKVSVQCSFSVPKSFVFPFAADFVRLSAFSVLRSFFFGLLFLLSILLLLNFATIFAKPFSIVLGGALFDALCVEPFDFAVFGIAFDHQTEGGPFAVTIQRL